MDYVNAMLKHAKHSPADDTVSRMVHENIRLVPFVAKKVRRGRPVTDHDISEGMVALFNAARGFNPNRGVKFSTYACRAIYFRLVKKRTKHDLTHQLAEEYELKLPDREHVDERDAAEERLENYRKAEAALRLMDDREQELCRDYFYNPGWTLKDVGKRHGITRERVRQIMMRGINRVRKLLSPGAFRSLADEIAD